MSVKIMVCIKQVPDTNQVDIDEETGVLQRAGVEGKLNPYDVYALETALRLKERLGAEISCITMGPPAAQQVLREAFQMGADKGYLLTDRAFAGADVLATSRTLARGIAKAGEFALILCGRQTTDGDTAQVGPAVAEHLGIPHVSWVREIVEADGEGITVGEDMMEFVASARMRYPCLITVEKGIYQPRLPSYLRMRETRDTPVTAFGLAEIGGAAGEYGLDGSPTQVERIFPPAKNQQSRLLTGDPDTLAGALARELWARKFA